MGCGFWFALLLILVGGWIWASNYGITVFSFYRDWPIIIVIVGIYIFFKIRRRIFWRKRPQK